MDPSHLAIILLSPQGSSVTLFCTSLAVPQALGQKWE